MSEQVVEQFIYTTAAAATGVASAVGTRIHAEIVPQGGQFPCILFSNLGGTDMSMVSGGRLMSTFRYKVVVVGLAGFSEIDAVAAALCSALHQQRNVTTASGEVLSSLRIEPFSMVERVGDKPIYHRGGIFSIRTTD